MISSIDLETRRIRLRSVQKRDMRTLFKWRNGDRFRFLFHYDESEVNYQEFCEEFAKDTDWKKFQFLAEKKSTLEPVGLTFIHSYSEEYQFCFLNIFLNEAFEK